MLAVKIIEDALDVPIPGQRQVAVLHPITEYMKDFVGVIIKGEPEPARGPCTCSYR